MIIRIDVQDNDYAETIAEILDRKTRGMMAIYDDYFYGKLDKYADSDDTDSLKKYREVSIQRDNIKNWIFDDEIPKDKVDEARDILKECVMHLIRNKFSKNDIEYLGNSIEISFPKTMKAEWENGEVIYYIPNTYSENKFMLF